MNILVLALLTGLSKVIESAVVAVLPEQFVKKQVLRFVQWMSRRTKYELDDKIALDLEHALYPDRKPKCLPDCPCNCHTAS